MVIRSRQRLNYSNSKPFNIVLVNPEIPPNTGNIARLCAATGSKLHLVHPLGFEITDKELKRAGLDYWHLLDVKEHDSWEEFYACCHPERSEGSANGNRFFADAQNDIRQFWFLSTRGEKNIWDVKFNPGDFFIFGSETKGLSGNILNENKDFVISIPMNGKARSINLSTAVGIVLYEGLRQIMGKKLVDIVPV